MAYFDGIVEGLSRKGDVYKSRGHVVSRYASGSKRMNMALHQSFFFLLIIVGPFQFTRISF